MCIILDTNIFADMRDTSNRTASVVHEWLRKEKGRVVYSPIEEWSNYPLEVFLGYSRVDLLITIPPAEVCKETRRLLGNPDLRLRSNDAHILALAKLSGARILYSRDRKLHQDFKNPAIIDGGMVYTKWDQRKLLFKNPCRK